MGSNVALGTIYFFFLGACNVNISTEILKLRRHFHCAARLAKSVLLSTCYSVI